MKRIMLGVALLLAACNADDFSQVEPNEALSAKQFRGIMADADAGRTYIDEDVHLRWIQGDKVSIFTETSRNKWSEFLGETGRTAGDFSEPKASGFGTGTDINTNYSIYPYNSGNALDAYTGVMTLVLPATQSYAVNSFGVGANAMTAVTRDAEDYDLRYRNVGGYIRFRLYGADITVRSLVLTATGGQPLSGKVHVTHQYGGNPSIEFVASQSSNSVTIDCPEGVTLGTTAETATDFWFVVPPVTMAQGFSLVVNGFYGGSWTKTTSAVIAIERNKYRNVNPLQVTIASSDTGMGVGGWGDGENVEEQI